VNGLLHRAGAALPVLLAIAVLAAGYRVVGSAGGAPAGGDAASGRPAASFAPLVLDGSRPSLVVFVHSACPCTRTAVGTLAAIAREAHGRLAVQVVFEDEESGEPGAGATPLWNEVTSLRGMAVRRDEGGALAADLGVTRSGTAVLFDASGIRLFTGGLTPAEAADSQSLRDAVARALSCASQARRDPAIANAGCSFRDLATKACP
jgi:hypothetical protein